jgi:UDP-N-acetylmuramoyl-tripeptide--D-alanyl-D-alanine ligase
MSDRWNQQEIALAMQAQLSGPLPENWYACGVGIDSRKLAPYELFFALRGLAGADGHDYLSQAFAAGAAAAIVTHVPEGTAAYPLFVVADVQKALEAIGQHQRTQMHGKVIAITGSVGKTTSSYACALAFSALGKTHHSEGSFNNHLGVPITLARMPKTSAYAVCEVGMNHAGEILGLTSQIRPDIAIITTIEAVHLEHFGTLEKIADAKAEIFAGMSTQGIAILNRDNSQFERLSAAAQRAGVGRTLSFGEDATCDIRLISYQEGEQVYDIEADVCGQRVRYQIGIAGLHHARNTLGVLGAVYAAGGDVSAAATALKALTPRQGRGQHYPMAITLAGESRPLYLIDESYNASPVATRAAIKVLGDVGKQKKLFTVAVLANMYELGPQGPQMHAELAASIQAQGIDGVVTVGALMENLYEALPETKRLGHYADIHALLSAATRVLQQATEHGPAAMIVKGSLSTKMSLFVQHILALGSRSAL